MSQTANKLLPILLIAKDVSRSGQGLSLREALKRANYSELRTNFESNDLVRLLYSNGELLEHWLRYSEDKRTTDGWYLLRSGEIGQVLNSKSGRQFQSLEEAASEFIVRELDYWSEYQLTGW